MKTKIRIHNEWFRKVSLGGRKSCPSCKQKLDYGESVWSWGEYVRGKWHTVKYFCKKCFHEEVQQPLSGHADGCGCKIVYNFKNTKPDWVT